MGTCTSPSRAAVETAASAALDDHEPHRAGYWLVVPDTRLVEAEANGVRLGRLVDLVLRRLCDGRSVGLVYAPRPRRRCRQSGDGPVARLRPGTVARPLATRRPR